MGKSTESWPERGKVRIALAALLIVHGLIHVIAPLATWGLVDFENIEGMPSVAMPDALANGLGTAWLVTLVLFVVAGIAVFRHRRWWVPVAIAGVVVSQVVIILWWEGAWRGTIANALILAAVWATRPTGTRLGLPR